MSTKTSTVYNSRTEDSQDDWETPDDFFAVLKEEFRFKWDMAADRNNSKMGASYLGPGSTYNEDSLSCEWDEFANLGEWVWLNPEFTRAKEWILKAYDESRNHGIGVVMLLPASLTTTWFFELVRPYVSEIRIVKNRLAFSGKSGNNTGSVIVLFPPWGRKGEVNVYFWDWRAFR